MSKDRQLEVLAQIRVDHQLLVTRCNPTTIFLMEACLGLKHGMALNMILHRDNSISSPHHVNNTWMI